MIVNTVPKRALDYDNPAWRNWGIVPLGIGGFLAILGILIQILEIVRIYNGLYNNGIIGLNLSTFMLALAGPGNPPSTGGQFLALEQWHFWPWTYPGSQFGLLIMIAGITGIVSAYRKSYSTIFAFFALSLFSFLLSIFLIIYYSIMLNYYRRLLAPFRTDVRILAVRNIGADSGPISNGVTGANLAFSVLSLVTALLATIYAGRAGRIGTQLKRAVVPVLSYPNY